MLNCFYAKEPDRQLFRPAGYSLLAYRQIPRPAGEYGNAQGFRVRQPNIFRCRKYEAAANKGRILPTLKHAGQPIQCGIDIAAPDGFYQGGDNFIVAVAIPVMAGQESGRAF